MFLAHQMLLQFLSLQKPPPLINTSFLLKCTTITSSLQFDDHGKNTKKRRTNSSMSAMEKESHFELDPDKAREALAELDQQLQSLSQKQVTPSKDRRQRGLVAEVLTMLSIHYPLAFVFGLLGNIFSFMVFLAPLPTFYRVYKKKSTEEYQSLPYVVALLSSMLWIYYASLKPNAYFLITVNSIGCILESLYTVTYMVYAPKKQRIMTVKLLVWMNLGFYSLIFLLTFFLLKGSNRVQFLGWACDVFSVGVFAAPLSAVRLVIRTKSVQFMPFSLSLLLTISAIMWFSYGVLLKDLHIALPNILGFIMGVIQMVLYAMYKDSNKIKEEKKQEQHDHLSDVGKLTAIVCSEVNPFKIDPKSPDDEVNKVGSDDQNMQVNDDHQFAENDEGCKIHITTPMELQIRQCQV
ncbi:bidirectional sugar transporter N3-like [Macadamia integrifolia]|uniref:bidirectional sugar transporter N3-like n=1 Tax=Macadamia integrifolia TaxID=60698 RepID=UPI001C52B04A|nr:bidirectional sugar transporter N3-like [Macadamia integrifolia]